MLVPDGLSLEEANARIEKVLEVIYAYGQVEGDDHKAWVINRAVKILMGQDYHDWVTDYEGDPDDWENYSEWNKGIAP